MADRPPPAVPPRLINPPPGFNAEMSGLQDNITPLLHRHQPTVIHNIASTPYLRSAVFSQDSGFASPDMYASIRRPTQATPVSPVSTPNAFQCGYTGPCNNALFSNLGRVVGNSPHNVYYSAQAAHAAHGYTPCLQPGRASSAPPQPTYVAQPPLQVNQTSAATFSALEQQFCTPNLSRNPFVADASSSPTPENVVPTFHTGHPAPAAGDNDGPDEQRLKNFNRLPSLPEFMEKSPEYWFRLIEAIFRHTRLDESDRFVCLIRALAPQEKLLSDILSWPDAPDNYARAKATILQRLGHSTDDGIRKVLSEERLGKSTPSQLWRRLRDIAPPEDISDSTLRVIWLDKLPAFVSMEISNAPRAPVEQTLEHADRVFENFNRVGGMHGLLADDSGIRFSPIGRGRGRGRGRTTAAQDTASAPGKKGTPTPDNSNSNRRPGSQSSKKVQFVDDKPLRMPPPNPEWCREEENSSPDPPPLPSSPPLPTDLPLTHQLCHFHYRFGASARKCRPPCNHPNARRS